jgi:hypothetical protein
MGPLCWKVVVFRWRWIVLPQVLSKIGKSPLCPSAGFVEIMVSYQIECFLTGLCGEIVQFLYSKAAAQRLARNLIRIL